MSWERSGASDNHGRNSHALHRFWCGLGGGVYFTPVAVVRTLLARRKIRCAGLGAEFNLPMSYVTLAEDALMAGMAAVMLVAGGHA